MVQFEVILQQQVITKWEQYYLDYKGLKRLIKKMKSADERLEREKRADTKTPLLYSPEPQAPGKDNAMRRRHKGKKYKTGEGK